MPEPQQQRIFLLRSALPLRRWTRAPVIEPAIEEAPAPGFVRRRERAYRRLLAGADVLAALAGLVLVVGVAQGTPLRVGGVIAAIASLVLVNKVSGLYDRDELVLHRSTVDEIPKLLQISGLFSLTTWLLHKSVTTSFLSQQDILTLWVMVFGGLVLGRAAARWLAGRLSAPQRCLVVGDSALAQRVTLKMRDSHVRAEVVATLPLNGGPVVAELASQHAFTRFVCDERVDRVIVAQTETNAEHTVDLVRMAKAVGLHVSLLPRLLEVVGSSVEFDELDGLTVLGVRRFGLSRSSRAVKRALDLTGATLGLLSVAPLFALIALAIRLDGRGPVFFRQTRVGRDNQRFGIIKFRTMVPDAESLKDGLRHRNEATGLFKIADDPRITRVGRLLRGTSLDELPQLLNVLRGEMSLVGPRPLVEEEDAMVLGYDRSRLHLTPGMTGHWQILGSARIPMAEMVAIDYLYVANWSLWGDIKILLRTVRHVFARGGM